MLKSNDPAENSLKLTVFRCISVLSGCAVHLLSCLD